VLVPLSNAKYIEFNGDDEFTGISGNTPDSCTGHDNSDSSVSVALSQDYSGNLDSLCCKWDIEKGYLQADFDQHYEISEVTYELYFEQGTAQQGSNMIVYLRDSTLANPDDT
jgi:hypothetical protein